MRQQRAKLPPQRVMATSTRPWLRTIRGYRDPGDATTVALPGIRPVSFDLLLEAMGGGGPGLLPGVDHAILNSMGGNAAQALVGGGLAEELTASQHVVQQGQQGGFSLLEPAAAAVQGEELFPGGAVHIANPLEDYSYDPHVEVTISPSPVVEEGQNLLITVFASQWKETEARQFLYKDMEKEPWTAAPWSDPASGKKMSQEERKLLAPGHRLPLNGADVTVRFADTLLTTWRNPPVTGRTDKYGNFQFIWTGFNTMMKWGQPRIGWILVDVRFKSWKDREKEKNQPQVGGAQAVLKDNSKAVGTVSRAVLIVPSSRRDDFDPLERLWLLQKYEKYDQLGPGPEDYAINKLWTDDPYPASNLNIDDKLVIILANADLATPASGADSVVAELGRLRDDITAEGFRARIVWASIYDGTRHVDGKIVLALRQFFRDVKAKFPNFAGAVLVGRFPEAMLVRKTSDVGSQKGADGILAYTSDIVLADLNGDWENLWLESDGTYNDFFLLDERKGKVVDPEVGMVDRPLVAKGYRGYQRFPGERDRYFDWWTTWGNDKDGWGKERIVNYREKAAVAIPDILISRINPFGIASLDEIQAKKKGVDYWGRRLLLEYLQRNHAFREAGGKQYRDANYRSKSEMFSNDLADKKKGDIGIGNIGKFEEWLLKPAMEKHIYSHGHVGLINLAKGGDIFRQKHFVTTWSDKVPKNRAANPSFPGSIYYTATCFGNVPSKSEKLRYNDPEYGRACFTEQLLFLTQGLLVIGRSHKGDGVMDQAQFPRIRDAGYPLGEIWRSQMLQARRKGLPWRASCGNTKGKDDPNKHCTFKDPSDYLINHMRKDDYRWGLRGDWTLRWRYPAP